MSEPLTHGELKRESRQRKLCKCVKCGVERICLPSFDFYTLNKDGPTGPLYCETCFLKILLPPPE